MAVVTVVAVDEEDAEEGVVITGVLAALCATVCAGGVVLRAYERK